MKVIVVNEFTRDIGGTDIVVLNHVEALKKLSIDYRLFIFSNNEFDGLCFLKKIKMLCNVMSGSYFREEFESLINDFNPDIIHVHNLYPIFFRSLIHVIKKKNVKVIIHLHNFYPFCLNSYLFQSKNNCLKCYQHNSWLPGISYRCYNNSFSKSLFTSIRRTLPKNWVKEYDFVNRFIAVSNFVREKYIEFGADKEKIKVIYNPIETDLFNNNMFSKDGYYVLYIGSLLIAKGLETLLKAARLLPEINFIIAGNGRDKNVLLETAKGLHNVKFIGPIKGTKKNELINSAKFLVIPSECWETFGLVVLEANAFGKVVLTSGMGGLNELVEEGKNGYYFVKGNYKELAEKISFIWNKIEVRDKVEFCKNNTKKFNINFFSEELLKTYIDVLSLGN